MKKSWTTLEVQQSKLGRKRRNILFFQHRTEWKEKLRLKPKKARFKWFNCSGWWDVRDVEKIFEVAKSKTSELQQRRLHRDAWLRILIIWLCVNGTNLFYVSKIKIYVTTGWKWPNLHNNVNYAMTIWRNKVIGQKYLHSTSSPHLDFKIKGFVTKSCHFGRFKLLSSLFHLW